MTREVFITTLYEENRDFLYALCRKRVRYQARYDDLIDDCIQETFLLAVDKAETLMNHDNPRGWLARTCLNRLMTQQRKQQLRQRIVPASLDEGKFFDIDAKDQIETFLESEESHSFLQKLIAALDDNERAVFNAYFVEHSTMKTIAANMQTSENHVKNLLKRMRRKAKKFSKQLTYCSEIAQTDK